VVLRGVFRERLCVWFVGGCCLVFEWDLGILDYWRGGARVVCFLCS